MKNFLKINYQKLKALRGEKKLTQTQIADLLNIHPSTYSKFEKGCDKHIDIEKLKGCADVFGISFYDLLIDEIDLSHVDILIRKKDEIDTEIREIKRKIDRLSEILNLP